ncbi:hypothetical protein BLOT_000982 [Blomia tropicalis]|nr:hypothetical protein BLOT_000982 [Blomia tropicalis]
MIAIAYTCVENFSYIDKAFGGNWFQKYAMDNYRFSKQEQNALNEHMENNDEQNMIYSKCE